MSCMSRHQGMEHAVHRVSGGGAVACWVQVIIPPLLFHVSFYCVSRFSYHYSMSRCCYLGGPFSIRDPASFLSLSPHEVMSPGAAISIFACPSCEKLAGGIFGMLLLSARGWLNSACLSPLVSLGSITVIPPTLRSLPSLNIFSPLSPVSSPLCLPLVMIRLFFPPVRIPMVRGV